MTTERKPKPKDQGEAMTPKKTPTRAYLKKLARMRGMWLGYCDGGYRLVYDERFSGDFAASFDNITTKREDSQVRILLERAILDLCPLPGMRDIIPPTKERSDDRPTRT